MVATKHNILFLLGKIIFLFCGLGGILFAVATLATDAVVTPEQLRRLETRIQELQTEMNNTRTEYGRLQNQLQNNEEGIGEIAERLEMLNEELRDKQNSLKDLQSRHLAQQDLLKKQRQILAKQIRASYMIGRQDYLKLWLNQQDPFSIGRVLTYYDYFNRVRARQIAAINTTMQRITTLKQAIAQETTKLNQLTTQQNSNKQLLESSYNERQKILQQLANTLENQDKELKRLQEDKQQLQTLLGTLEDVSKDIPPPLSELPLFAKLKGQLPYPVQGQPLKQFGEPLVGGLKWQGVLLSANVGDKVRTVAAGRVVFAEWFRNLGLLVIVDHGKGYMSLYGHNQSLYTKTGKWVSAGEVIASVGNSGGLESAALYFEIRQQGTPTNPLVWLVNK